MDQFSHQRNRIFKRKKDLLHSKKSGESLTSKEVKKTKRRLENEKKEEILPKKKKNLSVEVKKKLPLRGKAQKKSTKKEVENNAR